MPVIDEDNRNLDQTVKIYDGFYDQTLVINASEFDIVLGYFTEVCTTKKIAANFTTQLFRISQNAQIPVMTLLEYIKGTNTKLQMNQLITYYLNSFKSKTTLYGVSVVPRPNQSVARNVVQ